MPEFSLIYALLIILLAYYLKGFSGFGPALIFIPTITLMTDPGTAIASSAFFDALAGIILLVTVFRKIDWCLVLPVALMLLIGAYPGALLLKHTPTEILKILMGFGIMVFVIILIFSNNNDHSPSLKNREWIKYAISLFSGFMGGFIGITGPALIIYLKLRYKKDYFRTQLIAIFFFGALWRYSLYKLNGIQINISGFNLFLMGITMLAGLFLGYKTHISVNEKRFNQVIALVLIIPAIHLFYSGISNF